MRLKYSPVFAALLFGAAAHAEPPRTGQAVAAAAATPSREAVEAALRLFEDDQFESQMLAGAMSMTEAAVDTRIEAMKAEGTEFPEELAASLRTIAYDETRAMVEEMAPTFRLEAAMIYARHFTVGELAELKALQSSPVMQKAERLAPELMGDIGRVGMKIAAARAPEMERKVADTIRKWLEDQELGAEGPKT